MRNPVRRAASLILCRDSRKPHSIYDYEILLLQRKSDMKSWGSMMVFPGGKYDHHEDNQYASKFGFCNPSVVTALRECFEETGIFLTRSPLFQTSKIQSLNELKMKFLASQFSPTEAQLLPFFEQLSHITAPQNDLLPFMRLVTVPIVKARFDASFFIHKLEPFKFINFLKYAEGDKHLHEQNDIIMCGEYNLCNWLNPVEVLKKFVSKEFKLAPPQFIMLNIMSNFPKYSELIFYLKECSQNPINMGPNVVSMINNQAYSKEKFPYAATLIGDSQFPYDNCIDNESNQYLITELRLEKQKVVENEGKNRFLFTKPQQFFEEDYSLECTVAQSVLNKFQTSQQLRKTLEYYQ